MALLAVTASMYAVYHGPEGLKNIARAVHERAADFAASLEASGVQVKHADFFDTVAVQVERAPEVVDKLLLEPALWHELADVRPGQAELIDHDDTLGVGRYVAQWCV